MTTQTTATTTTTTATRTLPSRREAIDRVSAILDSIDPRLASCVLERAGLGKMRGRPFSAAEVQRFLAVLKDIRTAVDRSTGPGSYKKEMLDRRDAVRAAKEAVAVELLKYTRPVETAYRQLDSLFSNADGKASVIVVPATAAELSDETWKEYEHDYLRGNIPPKLAALRTILKTRNNNLAPAGWVGFIAVPDVETWGFEGLLKALGAFSEEHRTMLLVTPRCDTVKGDPIKNLIEHMRTDAQAKILGNGQNARAVFYVGDVVARDAFTGGAGDALDAPIVIPPNYAVVGAMARNDAAYGLQKPPAQVKQGAGGELTVLRVTTGFTEEQWVAAHNADPQRMNIVFYHPEYGRAFVFGAHIGGDLRGRKTLGVQRILDKMAVLARKLFIEELGEAGPNTAHRKADLQKKASQIVRYQEKLQALRSDGNNRIEVTPLGDGEWKIEFVLEATGLDVRFDVKVKPHQKEEA